MVLTGGIFDVSRFAVAGVVSSSPNRVCYCCIEPYGFIKIWAMQSPDQLVIYRTDVRQVVICGVYFWVGIHFMFNISRIFTTTSILGAVIIFGLVFRAGLKFLLWQVGYYFFSHIGFGLAKSPILSRLTKYDYSYGIYIYAFPFSKHRKFWPQMPIGFYLLITGIATVFLAALSWHWIERPALKLKPSYPRIIELNERQTLIY